MLEGLDEAKHRKKNGENRRECIVVYCEVSGYLFDADNVVRRCVLFSGDRWLKGQQWEVRACVVGALFGGSESAGKTGRQTGFG